MPKTILYFNHTAKLGGGEIALLNLIKQLDHAHYLPVVVLASEGPLSEQLETAGIETHVIPLASSVVDTRKDTLDGGSLLRLGAFWHALTYAVRLARFIKQRAVDLVHTNSLKADIIGGLSARLARVPVIWHVRDRIDADYLPKLAVRGFRWLCRIMPSVVIANSKATLETLGLPPQHGAPSPKGMVVHDGTPATPARPLSERIGPPVIGLVGRISPWKGQHIFIAAARLVRERFPAAKFQIIGSAMFGEEAYEKEMHALAAERGMDDCIEFTGFRTDVPDLIQAMDVLVHASTTGEPFGQVVVEGMIAGKPIVATNGGGIPEIVKDGETGLLVPMGDANAMAKALLRLLSEPDTAAAMGAAGRKRALDSFTSEHTARKVEAIYSDYFFKQSDRASITPQESATRKVSRGTVNR